MHKPNRPVDRPVFKIYAAAWRLAMPFLKRYSRVTEGFDQRVLRRQRILPVDLWIQAASGGEAYLAWEILKHLPPQAPISALLTTHTPQGMLILQRAAADILAIRPYRIQQAYFPFDRPDVMKRAVSRFKPRLTVLLETEIWPSLLASLHQSAFPSLIVNARMTPKSLARYRLWANFWRSVAPNAVLAVSKPDQQRFAALFGSQRVTRMSNIKFDRIDPDRQTGARGHFFSRLLPPSFPFVVLGSIRRQEERHVMKIITHLLAAHPRPVIGLFPRHLQRVPNWQRRLQSHGIKTMRRSRISDPLPAGSLILGDVFGELDQAYAAAKAAFVGGSLYPLGGQNFLEPLVKGIVPVIGPHWDNFYWVGSEIIQQRLLRRVRDWKGVVTALLDSVNKPDDRSVVKNAALRYIQARQGGARQAADRIRHYLMSVQ